MVATTITTTDTTANSKRKKERERERRGSKDRTVRCSAPILHQLSGFRSLRGELLCAVVLNTQVAREQLRRGLNSNTRESRGKKVIFIFGGKKWGVFHSDPQNSRPITHHHHVTLPSLPRHRQTSPLSTPEFFQRILIILEH